jgi:hypothetical protein
MTTETSGCIVAPWGHITATALWLLLPQLALAYVPHNLNSLCIPELSLVCHFQQVAVHLLILFI